MSRFKLSDWANISEIIASFVIVVSLVYVGFEINQNTHALQHNAYQNVMILLADSDLALATDPELNKIVEKGEVSPDDLSDDDWSVFSRYAFRQVGTFEYIYLAWGDGMISDVQWGSYRGFVIGNMCRSGYQRFWQGNQWAFSPQFIEFVRADIASECRSQ